MLKKVEKVFFVPQWNKFFVSWKKIFITLRKIFVSKNFFCPLKKKILSFIEEQKFVSKTILPLRKKLLSLKKKLSPKQKIFRTKKNSSLSFSKNSNTLSAKTKTVPIKILKNKNANPYWISIDINRCSNWITFLYVSQPTPEETADDEVL